MTRRPALPCAVAVLIALVLAAPSARAKRVSVPRAAIARMDVTRLSDVLARLGAWNAQSADGYTWQPTPDALSTPRATDWAVVLDGHALDASVFDAHHLEMAPVSLAEIDSIVFDDGAGTDGARGRVEIFTARAPRGFAGGGALSAGNETGDPGPYRYTSNASPNVDAIGPDASVFLSYGGARAYAVLSAGLAQHPFTDDAIRERTTTELATLRPGAAPPEASSATSWFYDPTWPTVLRTGAALRAGVRAAGSWHDAIFSVSDAKRYFHYSEPFGGEVPTDQRLVLGALSGGFGGDGGGGGTRVGYRASAQEKSLEDRDDALAFDYDWGATRLCADADASHALGSARVRLDAGVERREADDPREELTTTRDTFTRAGVTVSGNERARVSAAATLSATFAGGGNAPGAEGRVRWIVRDADTLAVSATHRTRLFAEDDNLWLWSERGYSLLASQGIAYSMDGAVERTAVTSADVRWTSSGVLGAVDLALGVRRFDDAYLEERAFTFEPESCTFESPTRVVTGQAGTVGLLDFRLRHKLGDDSRGDFSFAYVEEFESDASFSRAWQTVPRHRISYAMTFHPHDTWTLRGRVAHRSGTSWADYRGVDGAVCRTDGVEVVYHANVPAATTFDLFVQHRFRRQSTALDLIARNLFGADLRDHPAGATTDFTLYVQLRVARGGTQ